MLKSDTRVNRRRSRLVVESLETRTLLTGIRAPAVPLITSDPYLSVWSRADKLTDTNTSHWTGTEHQLVSLIRIDGVSYRLMGNNPSTLAAFPQTDVQVLPTRSIYNFDNAHVHVTMTFMQPALATDLNALTLPLSYITWDVRAVDGLNHTVQLFDSVSSQLAVNTTDQVVGWQRGSTGGLTTLRVGTTAQNYLNPVGDQVRINWGYAYLAANASQTTSSISSSTALLSTFQSTGALPNSDDANVPRAVNNSTPAMGMAFSLGSVGSTTVSRNVIVAYDEVKSINYFGQSLQPYWRRGGTTPEQMLTSAANNYATYKTQTAAFDTELMNDLTAEGGSNYAQLGSLAYRQTFAACGWAADPNGQLLVFPKENSSNGCISTVDILYPMFPQLLLFSPTIAKASLQPVMDYAAYGNWTATNAPHDLGTYPLATAQVYGGENSPLMAVEETANMLIMLDAVSKIENNVDYAAQYWPLIKKWGNFLIPYADTPGDQLTTDDFLGNITNSVNLAAKAIVGLGAFADLATRMGDPGLAATYTATAQADVTHWMTQSLSSDGTHWLLSYGQQGTGSQLYNLLFDKVLGINLFPASVAQKDIAYAKTVVGSYGVPIRSTSNMVGVEWSVWEAALATNLSDFQTLTTPLYNFINSATNRVPFTDKYDRTNLGNALFKARSPVGGVFAKMLVNPTMWSKWADRDTTTLGVYSGYPTKAVVTPSAKQTPQTWRYTTATPSTGWQNAGFSDGSWSSGSSAFGTAGTPGLIRNTNWATADIWLRRTFTMPAGTFSNIQLEAYYDEDAEFYINGVLAASTTGYVTSYVTRDISAAAKAQLVAGNTITLAVHCHQTAGGQGIDVGLVDLNPSARPGRISGTITGGQPGQTVFLDVNNNNTLDATELSTTTTSINVFNFSYVPTGLYAIRQVLPAGYTQVSPANSGGIYLNVAAGGAYTGQNFVDTQAPAAPSTPDLASFSDSGDSNTDNITATTTVQFTGFAAPNATVTLLVDGVARSSGTANASGAYAINATFASSGAYAVSARASNSFGTGPDSASMNVIIDTIAPSVGSAVYNREVSQFVTVAVGDGLAAQLNILSATLANLTTPGNTPAIYAINSGSGGALATVTFNNLFANGRYRLSFPVGAVHDVAGNPSPAYSFEFTQIAGDANGDGVVGFDDLLSLSQHYGTSGNTFSTGNFNYSSGGLVDFSDLLILSQNYGVSVLATAPAATVAPAAAKSTRRTATLAGLTST